MKSVRRVGYYILKELLSPLNYAVALLIGVTINYFQGLGIFSSVVPFVVPLLVQSLSKASVKMANRESMLLAQLPQHREDPTFVVDGEGNIIAMAGKTRSLFAYHSVNHLNQLLAGDAAAFLVNLKEQHTVELSLDVDLLDEAYTVKGYWQAPNGLLWFTAVPASLAHHSQSTLSHSSSL